MTETAGPPDERSYQSHVYFTKSRDVVFDALTSVADLAGWWSPVSGSGAEGGELRFRYPSSDPLVVAVDTAERPLAVAWTVLSHPVNPQWVGTRITFSLTANQNGTRLKFRHNGLTAGLECYTRCSRGWDHVLPSLRDYVETGIGSPLG